MMLLFLRKYIGVVFAVQLFALGWTLTNSKKFYRKIAKNHQILNQMDQEDKFT